MRFPVNPGRFLDEIHMHERLYSSLGHLTPAEVVELDMQLEGGAVRAYRAKMKASFKYQVDD